MQCEKDKVYDGGQRPSPRRIALQSDPSCSPASISEIMPKYLYATSPKSLTGAPTEFLYISLS